MRLHNEMDGATGRTFTLVQQTHNLLQRRLASTRGRRACDGEVLTFCCFIVSTWCMICSSAVMEPASLGKCPSGITYCWTSGGCFTPEFAGFGKTEALLVKIKGPKVAREACLDRKWDSMR